MIAGGSAAAVVGGLIIAVGVLAEIPTAGASTALVVGGVAVVGAGAGVAIAGGVDYGKKTKELKLAMESLSRAKSQFSAATNVNHYIQELSARTQEAMSAISSLQKGWQTLGNDFDITLEAFDRVDPDFAFFLCAQLEAANKNWKATLDQAKYINEQTNLPTKQGLINEDGKVDAHAQLVA